MHIRLVHFSYMAIQARAFWLYDDLINLRENHYRKIIAEFCRPRAVKRVFSVEI